MKTASIKIGPCAGHHFHGQADLQVAHHCERWAPDGSIQRGYRHSRKRLIDRAAYEHDARLGWEVDVWFEWH